MLEDEDQRAADQAAGEWLHECIGSPSPCERLSERVTSLLQAEAAGEADRALRAIGLALFVAVQEHAGDETCTRVLHDACTTAERPLEVTVMERLVELVGR